ncbi:hypothetical protein HDV63DRAFT_401731 [Trichoderma sp. SZMC 28014]
MPSRPRPNKVTKPSPGSGTRRASRSSLSIAAQEQLKQYAKEAANANASPSSNANNDVTALDTFIVEADALEDTQIDGIDEFTAANLLANGGSMASIRTSLGTSNQRIKTSRLSFLFFSLFPAILTPASARRLTSETDNFTERSQNVVERLNQGSD